MNPRHPLKDLVHRLLKTSSVPLLLLNIAFSCEIFNICSSVKEVHISHGFSKVTQGSSPSPDSLQVGQ